MDHMFLLKAIINLNDCFETTARNVGAGSKKLRTDCPECLGQKNAAIMAKEEK